MKKTYKIICICQILGIPLLSSSGKKPERLVLFIHLLNFFIMKTTTNTITAKVKRIIKKGHSLNGNPHYTLILEIQTGTEIQCKTVVNGSIGYGLTNYQNRYGIFTYHETKNGTIILDFAEDIK